MALSVASAALARGLGIVISLVSVPLTITYLGTERYGMWMTITSITGLLAFSDFGMGNGLLNAIADASGRDDEPAASRSVASAFYMLLAIAAAILMGFAIMYPLVPWPQVLNVTSPIAKAEAGPAVAAFITCFALSLPLGVVQRIQIGYQESFQSNLWQAGAGITSLCTLLIVIHLHGGLPWLVAAFSGTPALTALANLVVQFTRVRPWLLPTWGSFNWKCGKDLFGKGAVFFSIQVGSSITFSSDNFIIAHSLGQDDVARFSVGARLFSLVNVVIQLMFGPLWPAYGEAFARGDLSWVRHTLKRTASIGLVVSVAMGLFLVVIAPWFVTRWTRGEVSLPFNLLVSLCVSAVVFCSTFPHGIFLFGAGALRFSLAAMSLVAPVSVLAKMYLIPIVGLSGAAWGTALPYLFLNGVPIVFYASYLLTKREQNSRLDALG